MTEKTLPSQSQIPEKIPSKKEVKAIQKRNRQRELRKEFFINYLKSLWIYLPVFLSIATLKISFSLAMFIAGFTGVFIVVKKEVPSGLVTVRGSMAVAMGIMLIILFWGLAASYLIF